MASTIETSVRRALQDGNADDPDFRVQVYEAAERAIQRVVAEKHVGQAAADRQLEQLIAAIERIEADYPPGGAAAHDADEPVAEPLPAVFEVTTSGVDDASAPQPPLPDDETSEPALPPEDRHPVGDRPDHDAPAQPVPMAAEPPPAGDWSPGNRKPSASRSRRAPRWLVGVIAAIAVLALLAVAAWWLYASVMATPEVETGGMTVEQAIRSASGDTEESTAEWIGIFDGSDIEVVRATDGGRVTAEQTTGGRSGVRIEVPTVGGGTEIGLVVGPGVVRSLAGQTVRGELTVGSPDGTPREFSVRCVFAGDTTCGRQRFATSVAEETFIFDMEIPAGSTTEGQLAIDPGIGQDSRDLMVFALRLRPAA
ncbi:hypothetical protein GTW51_10700 [Aurantimonas aggregata]|uniref:Biotin transporter BioY n=1 Tax=Aurantimonas aggregata TaxID=2047720 RepID=A0A6L9MI74_9HYPH|nr:hypothetical protein [Aurantimonas aggregata]NDV87170.1 hypothetical protein [Aurantimonas aggregata]